MEWNIFSSTNHNLVTRAGEGNVFIMALVKLGFSVSTFSSPESFIILGLLKEKPQLPQNLNSGRR